jgi:hypothetical protein
MANRLLLSRGWRKAPVQLRQPTFMATIYPKPDAQAAGVAFGVDAGELARLREERDALKKALAIFARDQ